MPCYTERRTTLDLAAADQQLLVGALRASGWTVATERDGTLHVARGAISGTISNGRITLPETAAQMVNDIKRSYARAAVEQAGRKYGWQVQVQGTTDYRLTRRG